MSPDELLTLRKGLRMSRAVFAKELGSSARRIQYWESGERPINRFAENAIRWVLQVNAWRRKLSNDFKISIPQNTEYESGENYKYMEKEDV